MTEFKSNILPEETINKLGLEILDRYTSPTMKTIGDHNTLAEIAADYGLTADIAYRLMIRALEQLPGAKTK